MLAQVVLTLYLATSALGQLSPLFPLYSPFNPYYPYSYPAFTPVPHGRVFHTFSIPTQEEPKLKSGLTEEQDVPLPAAVSHNFVVPTPLLPQLVPVPHVQLLHKFHAQDGLGGYSFGYSGDSSSRHEIKDPYSGVIRGAMNYVDAEGKLQSRHYVADGLGFRVVATDLPVAPVDNSKPVEETEAVKAARAEHEAIRAQRKSQTPETKIRNKREASFFYSTSLSNVDTPANTFRAIPQPLSQFSPDSYPFMPTYGSFPNVASKFEGRKATRSESIVRPTLYSSPFHVPYYPIPVAGQRIFKAPTLTQINHHPGFAVTYRT